MTIISFIMPSDISVQGKKEEKADSFGEKMAAQVIKNLQINVSNIHIRYEDHFTNPKKPFSIGITLKNMAFQTTDENWKPTIIKDTVTKIYKVHIYFTLFRTRNIIVVFMTLIFKTHQNNNKYLLQYQ